MPQPFGVCGVGDRNDRELLFPASPQREFRSGQIPVFQRFSFTRRDAAEAVKCLLFSGKGMPGIPIVPEDCGNRPGAEVQKRKPEPT